MRPDCSDLSSEHLQKADKESLGLIARYLCDFVPVPASSVTVSVTDFAGGF